jgi:creatinine amidohydrolase
MKLSDSRRGVLRSLAGMAAAGSLVGQASGSGSPPLPASSLTPVADRYVHPRKVLLWESTRKEIRELIASGRLKAAIIPTGSTEQHNEHLAMIHDTASALLVAQQAALQLYPQVIVATPVAVGISPYWMARKGTLTLRPETFLALVFDIGESLRVHGVRNILIVNGHGGNDKPLKSQIGAWRNKLGVNIDACSYWEAYTASEEAKEATRKCMQTGLEKVPGHAGEFETSIALAAFPERVHREGVDYGKVKLDLKDAEDAKNDREFYYDSLLASSEKGEVLIRLAVDWVATKVRSMIASTSGSG